MKYKADHSNSGFRSNGLDGKSFNTAVSDRAFLRAVAPHAFVLSIDLDGTPIYRLAGREVRRVVGFDPRGKSFYELWDTEACEQLSSFFSASRDDARPFHLSSVGLLSRTEAVEFETVMIPISSEGWDRPQVIGFHLAREGSARLGTVLRRLQNVAYVSSDRPARSGISLRHVCRELR